jgi:hypothetical protein
MRFIPAPKKHPPAPDEVGIEVEFDACLHEHVETSAASNDNPPFQVVPEIPTQFLHKRRASSPAGNR